MASFMRLVLAAFVVTLTVFLLVFSCVLSNDWVMLVMLIPLILTPLPLVLLRCCAGDGGAFSSGPRGQHWCEFWAAFFFTGTVAIPILLYVNKVVKLESMALALSSVALALGGCGCAAVAQHRSEAGDFQAW